MGLQCLANLSRRLIGEPEHRAKLLRRTAQELAPVRTLVVIVDDEVGIHRHLALGHAGDNARHAASALIEATWVRPL